MNIGRLRHLDALEQESIYIIREAIAEAENPALLYSIGKDSSVLLHLALKAYYPSPISCPVIHVGTTWKFQEMIAFREKIAKKYQLQLIVHTNQHALSQGITPFSHNSSYYTDRMKTEALKQILDAHRIDIAIGGARRDEEKSRAKERIFSHRNQTHRWDPRNQRPEFWQLYYLKKRQGESFRVFPLSNWTELDIWHYIYRENIDIVPLYFAKKRPVVARNGQLLMVDDQRFPLNRGELVKQRMVRFRTLGCYPLTAAVESRAETIEDIIEEITVAKFSERQGRLIDYDAIGAMERKKQEGYF